MVKRKLNKFIMLLIMLTITMFSMSACAKESSVKLVNEMSFSLEDISDLTISYDDESISFYSNENENLMIREYMSKDHERYHARVSQSKNSIQISEGGKPFFKDGFMRYVEVYLPASYSSNLKVTTTDGNIDMSNMKLDMDSIRIDTTCGTLKLDQAVADVMYLSSTSGNLELGEISGDQIRIETTQGNVTCEKIDGKVVYTSTSGDAEFLSASGSGTYKANNSGILSVTYDEVTGDLNFFNKNDCVLIRLPKDLEFRFEAITKNGKIDTNFQGDISVNGDSTNGTVGSNPTVTIKVETKNGNIEVNR